MKKLLAFILFFSIMTSFSQENEYVFMVLVNDDIDVELYDFSVTYKDGSEKKFEFQYYLGRLKIKQKYVEEMQSDSVSNIKLTIKYSECATGFETYDIDFDIKWLVETRCFVLYIYDLSIKEYKRIYVDEDNKGFVFKIEISYNNSFSSFKMLMQKRLTKRQKRCRKKMR
jgi:hypothetical protein